MAIGTTVMVYTQRRIERVSRISYAQDSTGHNAEHMIAGLRWREIDMEQKILSVRQQVIRLNTISS
jgi:hypothetical protein